MKDLTGQRKILLIAAAAAAFLVSAVSTSAEVRPAKLKNSSAPNSVMLAAKYDAATGLCSLGAMQLMSKDELTTLSGSWDEDSPHFGCTKPRKVKTPRRAAYPVGADGRRAVGAVHLLLQLDRDGSIATVHPVCATDEAFAKAAIDTVKKIAFSPSECDGKGARATILLPLSYDP